MQLKPLLLIVLFLVLLFLLNYYEWQFILAPTQNEPLSFYKFFTYNFLLWTVVHLAKFVLLSVIMYAVSLLFTMEAPSGATRFKEIVGLVVLLEFVFFFQKIYKIIYFEMINTSPGTQDVMNFKPPSLHAGNGDGFLNTLFIELNLFTMIYIVSMVIGTKAIFGVPLKKALLIVVLSYALPLTLYVAIKT